jgi:hypothetical protein
MTTFSLAIRAARTRDEGGLTDILTAVEWVLTGVQGSATFELPGKTTMGPVDPQNFTPYAQLSQQQVLDWVNAIEDTATGQFPGMRAHIDMVVTRMAAEAALAAKPLPWATEPQPPALEPSVF